jgi:predicted MFS family arabinose efflux permease
MGRIVFLLSCAAFFSGAALRICDSLLPRLAHDFGITAGAAGRVIISFSVAYGLMQLVFGPLGDRFGKGRLVTFALVGCAIGAFACVLAPGFDALVALRVLWGMAAAGVIPVSMALIGDMVPYEERQATLARMLTGSLSGMMAGQLAGGLFADSAWGWRGAFASLAAGFTIVAVAFVAKVRIPAPPAGDGGHRSFISQLRAVVVVPWARVILLSVAIEGIFLLGPMAYLPAFLHSRYGLSLSAASALIALYAVGGLVYAVTARRIVRTFGEQRMVAAGGVLMGAAFAGLWLLPSWVAAGPLALLLGFGTYLYHNTLQTNATQMAPPAARGTAVALFAFCLFAGQALGVSVSGFALDRLGFGPLLLVPAVMLAAAGVGLARAMASAPSRS